MRKLIVRGGLLIAIGLALMALVSGWSRSDRITLPDGRILEVWATTYGTNQVAPGQFLQRLDNRLPKPAAKILRRWWPSAANPVQSIDLDFQSSLIVWFRFVGNSGGNRSQVHLLAKVAGLNATLAGTMFWPESGPSSLLIPQSPTLTLLHFPRNQKSLTLQLSVANPVSHIYESIPTPLRVRNPHPYLGPEFRAEPLPSVRTHRNVRAELVDLTVFHTRTPAPGGPMLEREEIQFTLKTETETHQPATISSAAIFDAGGNRIRDLIPREYQPSGDSGLTTFGPGRDLGSLESVYRLQIEALPQATPQNSEIAEFMVGPEDPTISASTVGNPQPFKSHLVPGLEIQKVAVENLRLETFFSCFVGGPAADAQVSMISIKDSKGKPVRFAGDQRTINDSNRFPDVWKTWRTDPSADRDRTPPYTLTFQILPFARFEFSAAPRHVTNSFPVPK